MTQDEFLSLTLRNPANKIIADTLLEQALPDAWIVSGCLVQTVWNGLTGRAVDYGIHDYDVFYFDPDTSWAAEDAVIRRLHGVLGYLGVKVEARNQARVHLWYGEKHGLPYPPLRCSTEGIDRFLTKNTRIGIRRTPDGYEVYAPDGFGDAAGLIVRPNPGPNFSAANYDVKAKRWKALWPEITVLAAEASPDRHPGAGQDP
ncbi:MAG: nucleotidyltransferase family protein [Rhizobiales bacterium]|nr:nucleotidyltransferase family protein [Hyphomicrobiales bacterium]